MAYEGNRIASVIELPSPYTDEARNKIVETFLASPPVDFLLMVDADIEFERDAISKTMWIAQNTGADVVWGNYSLGSFTNSLYVRDPDGSDLAIFLENLKPNMVYENIYAGGTGWCLITRKVLEEMREKCEGPWFWFARDIIKDENGKEIRMGEDLTFGKRVFSLGRKQVGYTGIFLVHHKLHATAPQFMEPIAAELDKPITTLRGA